MKRIGLTKALLAIAALLGGLLILMAAGVLVDGWRSFGHGPDEVRRARMTRSPQWRDGHFRNPQPIVNNLGKTLEGLFHGSPDGSPRAPLSVEMIPPARFLTAPATGLRITWMGHSTVLIEIDGHRVLTDPNWSERASPLTWMGPRRWYPPVMPLAELPALDAVLISHDHYDHLDRATVVALNQRAVKFIVPLGVGAHLAYWGVPEARIVELDWWQSADLGGLQVICAPARHASGRFLRQDSTLWGSFAFIGPQHRAFFSGDTGLFPGLKEIGARLGPFDVTMFEIGQYDAGWPDWHLGPEQAVTAHGWVRGRVLVPIHWGLLQLAYHSWTEPIERLLAAADPAGATTLAPRPGQSVEPLAPPPRARWWPSLPWRTADQAPIVSGQASSPGPWSVTPP